MHILTASGVISILSLSAFNLYITQTKPVSVRVNTVLASDSNVEHKKAYLQDLLKKNIYYLPAIVELTKIEKSQGNENEARDLFNRALEINANASEVKELEKLFQGK